MTEEQAILVRSSDAELVQLLATIWLFKLDNTDRAVDVVNEVEWRKSVDCWSLS